MRVLWAITWKEWLGLRWKLAALTAILLGPALGTLFYDTSFLPSSLVTLIFVYSAIAPIFLAMHAAAEDNSTGTLEFVRGLPISLAQWGLIRLLATLTVLLVPIVAAGAFTYAAVVVLWSWNPGVVFVDFSSSGIGILTAVAIATLAGMTVSASLFFWTTALSMNQPSELRAGLFGIVTAVVWGPWSLFTVAQWDNPGNWTWLYGITSLGPFAGLVLFDPGLTVTGRVAMGTGQLATMCVLVAIAARRYGILEPRQGLVLFRIASPEGALWWMQWRQAWPLGLTGMGIILGFALLGLATSSNVRDQFLHFRTMVYLFSLFVGAFWAIVVAASLFSAELEPRLVAFWRSRPIDPAAWFRIKYLTGAVTLLIFIDLPAALLGHGDAESAAAGLVAFLACVPVLHLAIYSVAVLIACVVRHTIYSGILSLGAVLSFVVAPIFYARRGLLARSKFIDVMQNLARALDNGPVPPDWLLTLVIYLAITVTVAVAATLLGRWAIQKDYAVRA
jgi:hypothetical protein